MLNIVTGSPGSNKTTALLILTKLLAEMGLRVLYLRNSHRQIKEDADFLRQLGVRAAVWEGFERKCPRYRRGDELIKRLKDEAHLTAEVLCQICDEAKGCSYKAQFKTSARVILAPVDYLWTGYPEQANPDIIIIDEPPDRWVWLPKLSEKDLKEFRGHFRFHKKFLLGTGRYTVKDFRRELARFAAQILEEELKKGASVDELVKWAKKAIRYDIVKLAEYLRLRRLYGRDQAYAVPYLFYALDFAREGKTVIYVDAYHDEELTGYLLEEYKKGRGWAPGLNVIQVEAPGGPKGEVIRVRLADYPDAWWSARSVKERKRTRRALARRVIRLARAYKAKKVGIITYKDAEPYLKEAVERALPGINVVSLHFKNLRSSNAMWDVDVLFVVGTYTENLGALRELARALFPDANLSFEDEKLPGGGYRYKDPRVEALRRVREDGEQYNAIHRARPVVRAVKVFVFGRVPVRVYKEGLPVRGMPIEDPLWCRVLQDLRRELEARGEVRLSEFIEAERRKLRKDRRVVWAWAMDAANYLWREGVARAEERPRGGRGRPALYLVWVKKPGD